MTTSHKTAHYITTGEKLMARIKRATKSTSQTILADFKKQSLKTFLLNQLTNNAEAGVTDKSSNVYKHHSTITNLDHNNENFELSLKPLDDLETIINAIEMFCLLQGFETFNQSSSYCKAEKIGETMFVTITQFPLISNRHIWITVNYQPFSLLDYQTSHN